jgi:hypothetical protein
MNTPDPQSFFSSQYNFNERSVPPYVPRSARRDRWLQGFWQEEPYLESVVHGAVSIDKNRAWELAGGRNLVSRYINIFRAVEFGQGWREFMSRAAQSYYTTDLGFIGLLQYDGDSLDTFYNVDPTLCQLAEPGAGYSLRYTPPYALRRDITTINLTRDDYLAARSMPSVAYKFSGLGRCAVSRCIEWSLLMIAIYGHYHEQLLSKAPKGLLLLQGVSQSDWQNAMQNRQVDLDSTNNDFYGKIKVLASTDATIDAKLIALSQLPMGFDLKTFTDLLMYGYALAFGYPAEEFWPLQGGSFGHSREVEANEQRSSSKGVGNFILDLQEEVQRVIPVSIHFEFLRRDTGGDMNEALLQGQRIANVMSLYDKGTGVISQDESRTLLASAGILPQGWTPQDEDAKGSDTMRAIEIKQIKERLMDSYPVQESLDAMPTQPIVHYQWPQNRLITLFDPNEKRQWEVKRTMRAAKSDDIEITPEMIGAALSGMLPEMEASVGLK